MKKPIVIGISGGSGSGKTSIAKCILEDLKKSGEDVVLLEQDSYYKKLDHLSLEERKVLNYDHPDLIDFDLLKEHILKLLKGEKIKKPIYDFTVYNRCENFVEVESKPLIIVEGILIFAVEKIRELLDIKLFVDTDDDIRLLRRIERDLIERKRDFENIKNQYLLTVKPMYLKYVEPSKRFADVIVPRGKDNQIGIKMVSGRLKYLMSKNKK